MRNLARLALLTILITACATAPEPPKRLESPGPIPTCFGEQATRVLIGKTFIRGGTATVPATFYVKLVDETIGPYATEAESLAAAFSRYQTWADAGVELVANDDNFLTGTAGHDVLVAIIPTPAGGIFGFKTPGSAPNPAPSGTAGDNMCALSDAKDFIYAAVGLNGADLADKISTGGGPDDIYTGGGSDLVLAGPGKDRTWGYWTSPGETQRIFSGPGHDHNYVGRNFAGTAGGKVIVDGGGSPVNVNGGGDHVHPCPHNSTDPKDLRGLEGGYTKDNITAINIEFFGDEEDLPTAPTNPVDPCSYQSDETITRQHH